MSLVSLGSALVSLGTFGVVGFTRVCHGGRSVHPWSLGSLGSALMVVLFIRVRWVHSGSPWGSLGSSGFPRVHLGRRCVGFIRGRLVHTGSCWGSLGSSGVVAFIRVCAWGRWVNPRSLGSHGFALRIVAFIRARWVHSRSPCVSLGSSGVVGFTRVRPVGRLIHPGSLGSHWDSSGVVGFTRT